MPPQQIKLISVDSAGTTWVGSIGRDGEDKWPWTGEGSLPDGTKMKASGFDILKRGRHSRRQWDRLQRRPGTPEAARRVRACEQVEPYAHVKSNAAPPNSDRPAAFVELNEQQTSKFYPNCSRRHEARLPLRRSSRRRKGAAFSACTYNIDGARLFPLEKDSSRSLHTNVRRCSLVE